MYGGSYRSSETRSNSYLDDINALNMYAAPARQRDMSNFGLQSDKLLNQPKNSENNFYPAGKRTLQNYRGIAPFATDEKDIEPGKFATEGTGTNDLDYHNSNQNENPYNIVSSLHSINLSVGNSFNELEQKNEINPVKTGFSNKSYLNDAGKFFGETPPLSRGSNYNQIFSRNTQNLNGLTPPSTGNIQQILSSNQQGFRETPRDPIRTVQESLPDADYAKFYGVTPPLSGYNQSQNVSHINYDPNAAVLYGTTPPQSDFSHKNISERNTGYLNSITPPQSVQNLVSRNTNVRNSSNKHPASAYRQTPPQSVQSLNANNLNIKSNIDKNAANFYGITPPQSVANFQAQNIQSRGPSRDLNHNQINSYNQQASSQSFGNQFQNQTEDYYLQADPYTDPAENQVSYYNQESNPYMYPTAIQTSSRPSLNQNNPPTLKNRRNLSTDLQSELNPYIKSVEKRITPVQNNDFKPISRSSDKINSNQNNFQDFPQSSHNKNNTANEMIYVEHQIQGRFQDENISRAQGRPLEPEFQYGLDQLAKSHRATPARMVDSGNNPRTSHSTSSNKLLY